ncbi:MAG: DNA-directed RNA polymerase subunit alpha C-terminal domain-containing protein, partial [Planctomycetia bacterium]
SPVTRELYEVEATRGGQKTNYDPLTMALWTDGTVTPEMALVEAAKILRKHLNPFVSYGKPGAAVSAPAFGSVFSVEAPLESRLGMLVSDLKLSLRAANCLEAEGIASLRDLVSRSREELLEVRNFGETTLQEIEEKLAEIGLRLGMQVPSASYA